MYLWSFLNQRIAFCIVEWVIQRIILNSITTLLLGATNGCAPFFCGDNLFHFIQIWWCHRSGRHVWVPIRTHFINLPFFDEEVNECDGAGDKIKKHNNTNSYRFVNWQFCAVWVWCPALNLCAGVHGRPLINSNNNLILLIIKSCVEIAKEDVAEAVFVGIVEDWLQTNLAIILFWIDLISITRWLDDDQCLFEFELDWHKLINNISTLEFWNLNLPVAVIVLDFFDGVLITLHKCIMLHADEDVAPDIFGELDAVGGGVDECQLSSLTLGHILAWVHEVVDLECPLAPAKIRINIHTILATLNLTKLDFTKSNLRNLILIKWILKV